jgi:hypothetical protein
MATMIEPEKGITRRLWAFRPQTGGDFTRVLEESALLTVEFGVKMDLTEYYEKGVLIFASG